MYRLGFIGFGNMSAAIVNSLLTKTNFEIAITDRNPNNVKYAEQLGIKTFTSNKDMVVNCDAIVLAVKPDSALDVLHEISSVITPELLLISIMAGVTIADIHSLSPCKVVRTMPNLSAKVSHSTTAIAFSSIQEDIVAEIGTIATISECGISSFDLDIIKQLFSAIGEYIFLEENKLDAVTAVSGSGTAYVYKFLDCLINAGIECGLDYDQARFLAVNTAIGAGKMCNFSNDPLDQMISAVCSKGGTTIEAINVFDNSDFSQVISTAVKAAYQKSKSLSKR